VHQEDQQRALIVDEQMRQWSAGRPLHGEVERDRVLLIPGRRELALGDEERLLRGAKLLHFSTSVRRGQRLQCRVTPRPRRRKPLFESHVCSSP
jgi:hypothetical protein